MCHSNVLKYVKGNKQYEAHHENQLTLDNAFRTAVSSITTQSDNVPENYKDAWAAPNVTDCMKACDVEMGKLRSLGCLGGPTTIISPSQRISHEKSIGIQIQNKRTWRSEISQPSIEIRSQMILSSPRSTLLRQLRSSSFLHNDTSTICTHKYPQLMMIAFIITLGEIM